MMKFGVFDQNDRGELPLGDQYRERLKLAEIYDQSGFDCFHMSEHHATSLSTAPSPNVFMAALTQRTHRMRLCPLVYLLPLYHPVRLAEEICMLDHLSGGRFEFGVGRGASPFELAALGVDTEQSAKMYAESLEIIRAYFESDELTYDGAYWQIKKLPVEMRPAQKPHPQIWYACASPESAAWPSRNGFNIVCGGPSDRLRAITDAYRSEWNASMLKDRAEPMMGINRYIIVAETDEEALNIGRRAWPTFYQNFMKLWIKNNSQPITIKLPPDFDTLVARGQAVAGRADSVASTLAAQLEAGGLNYLIGSFVFGGMSFDEAASSIKLFSERVMPLLKNAVPATSDRTVLQTQQA